MHRPVTVAVKSQYFLKEPDAKGDRAFIPPRIIDRPPKGKRPRYPQKYWAFEDVTIDPSEKTFYGDEYLHDDHICPR